MCARKGNNVCTVSLVKLWDLKGIGEKEVKKLFLFSMAVYVCLCLCVCLRLQMKRQQEESDRI